MKGFFSSLPQFLLIEPAPIEIPKMVSQQTYIKINNLPSNWISTVEQIFRGTPSSGAPSEISKLLKLSSKPVSLLCSWCFYRYSAPIHWLGHGHMTFNNETISRQTPWAGSIAKTMTSNGKQFTAHQGPVSRKSRKVFSPEKPFQKP